MDIGDSIDLWLRDIPPPDEPDPECAHCAGSGEADCEVSSPGELALVRVLVECGCKERP